MFVKMLKNHSDDTGLVLISECYYNINDTALLAKLDADKSGTKAYVMVPNVPEGKTYININPPEPEAPPEGSPESERDLGFLPGVKPPEPVQLPADTKPGEDDKPEDSQHPADRPELDDKHGYHPVKPKHKK